jgi:hypothetical protein
MSKHSNIDLLNEERLVNRKVAKPDYNQGFASAMTVTFNDFASNPDSYNAVYDPDKHQEKIYSQEDMDKVVMLLTLYIDDPNNRVEVEEAYQAMKDQGKI